MDVILTDPVRFALHTLGEDDRQQALAWFEHLKNWEKDEFIRKRSYKLESEENVYLLKATGDLRIFFKMENGTIEILDIAKQATLKQFGWPD